MYLKELRINGFKSFADATRLEFHRGVTAIVGPNGCGKSNIADAIRWVLGEQSSKSLRAGQMEDVIFQGTTTRKPLNLCEVSLVFTDCEDRLGTAFHEIEVTRRVIRGGGSDYFLNGKLCRLRDLQRIFLDTGIGTVSYSFLLQGQIDKVISSNPAERRLIFEEAAGISKYKTQRREALQKLAGVDANLARVTDVMDEVSRQIVSLKRQAAKAQRYQRIKQRLTRLDLAVAAHRHDELSTEIRSLEEEAGRLRERVANLKAGLERRETNLLEARARRQTLDLECRQLQQNVYDLRQSRETSSQQAQLALARTRDLQKRLEDIAAEVLQLEKQQLNLENRAADEQQHRQHQLLLFGDSDTVYADKNRALQALSSRVNSLEVELQNRRQQILLVESTLTRLRSHCTSLELDLKTYQVRHANLTEEIHRLEEDAARQEDQIRLLASAALQRQQEHAAAELALRQAQAEETGKRDHFRQLQQQMQSCDRELARLQAQIHLLERLQEKLEGFSDGAKAILNGQLGAILPAGSFQALTRLLRIEDPAQTIALETLLGTALEAIALSESHLAPAVTAAIEARKLGRACLQIPVPGRAPSLETDLPPWLIPADRIVTTDHPSFAAHVAHLLQGCYFAPSLADFLAYWEKHRDFAFLFVATTNGELVDRRGLIFSGKTGQPVREASFLQRAGEINRLKKDHARLQQEWEMQKQAARIAQEEADAAASLVEEMRKRVLEAAQELSTVRSQEKSARQQWEHWRTRRQSRTAELAQLEKGRADSDQRLAQARQELARGESELQQTRQAIQQLEDELAVRRQERDAARDAFNEVRLQISEKKQKLAALDRGLLEIEKQKQEAILARNRRLLERDQIHEQLQELARQHESQLQRAGELARTLEIAGQSLEQRTIDLTAAEETIRAAEAGLAADREILDRESTSLNSCEVRLTRLRAEWDFLAGTIQREYQTILENLDWKRELWLAGEALPERFRLEVDDDTPEEETADLAPPEPSALELAALAQTDWNAISAEAAALRARLNALGSVHLGAIEEYRELRERHRFLKTQSDDLWSAKEKLLAAIDEINRTSQSLFADTFAQIRKNFVYTFETLFGGGSADLELIDEADVLESGIEIIARPPGTRLRNLGLLSGGQKTMTAVALLFAIYMVKPSPFCVLDEIDAPLDDANIGRFCEMVKRFLDYSQFLIITHNKRTISNAHTIYGATMQERGVTKVVSMRFEAAAELAQSA